MDRNALSAASIEALGVAFAWSLTRMADDLAMADLETIERRLQAALRPVLGAVVEQVVAARATADQERQMSKPPRCSACGQPMRLVDPQRPRLVQGLVGDYRVVRAYYGCSACKHGQAPLDATLGLGIGSLSPCLARVVCRAGIEVSFPQAVDLLAETLQVTIPDEGVRRITEGIGAVAEAETQAAIGQVEAGLEPLAARALLTPPIAMVVTVDGVMVHLEDGWHECKTGVVASLGPELRTDLETGRVHLALGPPQYCAGLESAEAFWYRVYVEAVRRGLGRPGVALVVVLGDGADWIWRHARAFLTVGQVEVVEIVDFYHAVEHLWTVANAVFGTGSAQAAAWAAESKAALYTQGAPSILSVLAAVPATGTAAEEVRKALRYFGEHSQRMNYPAFVARQLPIGSGSVESACKTLIQAREKGAGMCWSRAGAQTVATLRALHRSGRWDSFWRDQPQRRRPKVFPHRKAPPTGRAA